ncbi:MAG TPA: penicillin acylase family protein [Solirubrobacteraceae bacterium]|nr:penicillin acylase family protein [Solirubrobacteraceae bacterium]
MGRRLLPAVIVVLWLAAAGPAGAQTPQIFTGFHSVLAFGEGENTSDQDLAAYEAAGTAPAADLNEDQQYEGLEQAWPGFTIADLDKYYKNSDFQPEPSPSTLSGILGTLGTAVSGSPPGVETPEPGVTVVRDSTYEVPRIYADTRAEAMWAAGYVTAEDRLFFMDVLRHVAEGTESELLGASSAASDSQELGVQDDSPQYLTSQMESLPQTMGAEGSQALSDIEQYVAGINAFIDLTKMDPARLPAEYPALGITPQPWTLADTAALGVYLIGQFTVFGGDQGQQSEALGMAIQRLGKKIGTRVYDDLRLAADPEAVTTLPQRFASDNPGRVNPRSVAMIDPGSLVLRNAQTGGPESASAASASANAAARLPAWARQLATRGLQLPHMESNAVLVDAKRSGTGQALAVMGPQVGYYTPEVFLEYEMHAPGIDVSGVSFPGSSPYPLIGHGIDFAWTGTSAFSSNDDVFAERLCNPDGSKPSFSSTHYLYKERCIPFSSRTIVEQTPVAPTSPSPPQTITMHTLDSVHGPIGHFATVHGVPVALATAPATAGHEAQSYVAFMRLAENVPTSPQSFIAAMRPFAGSENWFYVDDKNIAVLQSGWFPVHARGSDPDLPIWGTGQWDWKGFNPANHDYQRLPDSANPTSVDPPQGYLVNWNNALAHGWRVAAGDWSNGPVVRATILQDLLQGALKQGPLDLAGLTGMVTAPSLTADLRGMAVWPWLRRVIGSGGGPQVQQLVSLLDAWAAAGSQRRALAGSNDVKYGPAVLLMDTWWPLLVRAEFQPVVGQSLMDFISQQFNSIQPDGIRDGTGNGFFEGWEMDVQKDLRQVLHQPVRGRFSRTYCGGGSLTRCRSLLDATLLQAAQQLTKQYGASEASWQLPVTCPVTTPPSCDQIVPTSAGALNIPPQPYDNRGTFYQADAIIGHRPEPAVAPAPAKKHRRAAHHRRPRKAASFTG